MGYIYALTEPNNPLIPANIKYIGKTIEEPKKRLQNHISDSKRYGYRCPNWIKSLSEKGLKPDIHILIIAENDQLCELEIKTIHLYKTMGSNLINHTIGGDGMGGWHHTTLSKQKISLSRTGKNCGVQHPLFGVGRSAESKAKMSASQKGNQNPLGCKRSEETKRKISESQKLRHKLGVHHR